MTIPKKLFWFQVSEHCSLISYHLQILYYIHPGDRDSAPFKDDNSVLKDVCESTDHIIALVPAPIHHLELPLRTALLDKRTELVSRELYPPPNRDDTLSLIREQIRLSQKEAQAKFDKKFNKWEVKRKQDKAEDAKKLKNEKEATQTIFSEMTSRMEQQEAGWSEKYTDLKTQLDKEKALRKDNLKDLHRVSHQCYWQTS